MGETILSHGRCESKRGVRSGAHAAFVIAYAVAAGWMFWLTRNTLSGSYCALTRASRS